MSENECSETHWNDWYNSRNVDKLGWYQKELGPSRELLVSIRIDKKSAIIDVGTGASSAFVSYLLEKGYENIFAADLSKAAINKQKDRLGDLAGKVKWIVDDITAPQELDKLTDIDLWHDRAMLHFLTEDKDSAIYLDTLKNAVKPGGYVIIATFSLDGVDKCSMLPVKRYDEAMITEFLGEEFELKNSMDYLYVMPSGNTRPYVYTLFRRI
jgi:SAM-dependent methyltransferase